MNLSTPTTRPWSRIRLMETRSVRIWSGAMRISRMAPAQAALSASASSAAQ
jgi:hypothetical protein